MPELEPATGAPAENPRRRWAFTSWLDGARAVWLPAVVVGTLAFALIVWQLAIPRNYYTGTDSVAISSVVADVNVGQTLCVPGLDLPGETGRVQLALFAQRPRLQAAVSVIASGTTTVSRAAAVTGGGTRPYFKHRSLCDPARPRRYRRRSVCARSMAPSGLVE